MDNLINYCNAQPKPSIKILNNNLKKLKTILKAWHKTHTKNIKT